MLAAKQKDMLVDDSCTDQNGGAGPSSGTAFCESLLDVLRILFAPVGWTLVLGHRSALRAKALRHQVP